MIQIIKPARPPKILRDVRSRGPKTTTKLKQAYDDGDREFEFDSSIYGARSVKNALIRAQNKKCCFCESKITHIDYGDVEHFRPKGGTRQTADDDLVQPGYYWLAYDWSNLFLSCTLCNQRYKRNLFPLVDPSKRAISHHDNISEEAPVFINPSRDDPQQLIAFRSEIAYSIGGNERGTVTIDSLGLNRSDLVEDRWDQLRKALLFKETVTALTKMRQRDGQLTSELELLLEQNQQMLDDYEQPSTEYASMIQAAIAQPPLS